MSKDIHQTRDPVYTASERLATLVRENAKEAILKQLDPQVMFHSLTGTIFGNGIVTRSLLRFCELAGNNLVIGPTVSCKDLKTACTSLSVFDLVLQDTVTINHSLLITNIVRRRVPSLKKTTHNSRQQTQQFLRSLLEGITPRHNHRYPVLDFSYRHLDRARDLFVIPPRVGRKHVFVIPVKAAAEKGVATQVKETEDPEEDTIMIKGKNRDGDQAAYQFDRKEMKLAQEEQQVDSDDDDMCHINSKWDSYEASAIKLCNNNLSSAARLDDAVKRLCVNAFYFLTWIDLSFNKLTEIPDFSQFPLIILYLHANNIKNVAEVKKLRDLQDLQSLTLYGNPIQVWFVAAPSSTGPSRELQVLRSQHPDWCREKDHPEEVRLYSPLREGS